jgi:hypothetical protein
MGEDISDGVVKIVITVVFPLVHGVLDEPFTGEA